MNYEEEINTDQSFHYLLMANQAMVHKQLLDGLADTGLTIGQPKVLDYLKDHDGSNQRQLAYGCRIEPSSLTALLNRMEDAGLIERRKKDGNRRSYYIYMTEKGRNCQIRVAEEFQKLEEKAMRNIPKEDQQLFQKIFLQMYHNLEKGEDSDESGESKR